MLIQEIEIVISLIERRLIIFCLEAVFKIRLLVRIIIFSHRMF